MLPAALEPLQQAGAIDLLVSLLGQTYRGRLGAVRPLLSVDTAASERFAHSSPPPAGDPEPRRQRPLQLVPPQQSPPSRGGRSRRHPSPAADRQRQLAPQAVRAARPVRLRARRQGDEETVRRALSPSFRSSTSSGAYVSKIPAGCGSTTASRCTCACSPTPSGSTRLSRPSSSGASLSLTLPSSPPRRRVLIRVIHRLQDEPARVGQCLLEQTAIDSLVRLFCRTKSTVFDNLLEPLHKVRPSFPTCLTPSRSWADLGAVPLADPAHLARLRRLARRSERLPQAPRRAPRARLESSRPPQPPAHHQDRLRLARRAREHVGRPPPGPRQGGADPRCASRPHRARRQGRPEQAAREEPRRRVRGEPRRGEEGAREGLERRQQRRWSWCSARQEGEREKERVGERGGDFPCRRQRRRQENGRDGQPVVVVLLRLEEAQPHAKHARHVGAGVCTCLDVGGDGSQAEARRRRRWAGAVTAGSPPRGLSVPLLPFPLPLSHFLSLLLTQASRSLSPKPLCAIPPLALAAYPFSSSPGAPFFCRTVSIATTTSF